MCLFSARLMWCSTFGTWRCDNLSLFGILYFQFTRMFSLTILTEYYIRSTKIKFYFIISPEFVLSNYLSKLEFVLLSNERFGLGFPPDLKIQEHQICQAFQTSYLGLQNICLGTLICWLFGICSGLVWGVLTKLGSLFRPVFKFLIHPFDFHMQGWCDFCVLKRYVS